MPTPPAGTATVDLTASGNFGVVGDGVFLTGGLQPAGTGNFNTFVQIQDNGDEEGYNTDARPQQFDEKNSANFNHSILLANVPFVIGGNDPGTVEGLVYREFLLDLNEPNGGGKNYLSLDKLQIWQEESGSLTGFTPGTGFSGAHTNYMAYNLDSAGNNWVALNDSLSHGSGQSDVRVLIPDSVFVNAASHRYVYLYSAFGQQSNDWEASGGFEEWGLRGTSGGGPTNAFNITKSAAVDGDTADTVGEVITYSIKLFNTGNLSLTGITVTDPSVFDLTRGLDEVGNNDAVLNVGEVWTYSAHHVVTQADIDSAATADGEGFINNTVSAGSDQTGHLPEQLDTASTSVPVESRPLASLDKQVSSITSTDAVPGTTVVDAAGDVINYIISVSWAPNGNTTLVNPVVSDTSIIINPIVDPGAPIPNTDAQVFVPVLDGDNNLGDNNNNGISDPTDQNSARDPGETWQYVYRGDTNQNGFHDPGETWIWTARNLGDVGSDGVKGAEIWVGDDNQNGFEEPGEKWQFKNAQDTNSNGLQDNGEAVWKYQNLGDDNQNGTEDPGETFLYYNIGDTNQNGFEEPGETFQYYNVGDTNQNGIEDDGETFQFNHVLPGVDIDDDGFNDGDLNTNGNIDAGETWFYTASYVVTQADIDNRIAGVPTVSFDDDEPPNPNLTHDNTATLDATPDVTASGSASVPIDQNPAFTISKVVTDVGEDGSDGHVDEAGDIIRYTITVANTGNMTLTGVTLDDPLLEDANGTLSAATESLSANGELDVGETWTYTGTYTAQQSDINDNGGGDGDIDNTATAQVVQLEDSQSSSTATLIDRNPDYSIVKTVTDVGGDGVSGHVDAAGDVITYQIVVDNLGNVDLTGTSVIDALLQGPNGTLGAASGDTIDPGILNVGETWTYIGTYTAQQSDIDSRPGGGTIDNTATVQSDELADENSDTTATPVDYNPGFTFSIEALGYHDNNGSDSPDDGDIVDFSTFFTNTGNVTLTNVAISSEDGLITFANGPVPTLAPGEMYGDMTGTHLIQGGETELEETYVGQSDQIGNILVELHVEFAPLPELEEMLLGGGYMSGGGYL